MESKLKIVFEVSKSFNSSLQDLNALLEFITNFIVDSNGITEFYFIFDLLNKDEQIDLVKKNDEFKNKILSLLKSKNFSLKNTPLFFGSILNPLNLDDDNKLIFYKDLSKSKNETELLNDEIIIFYSTFDLYEYFHINGFFSYFLNFFNDISEKEIKKILKNSNGVIDASSENEINFSTVNYEFLTFVEEKENQ